MSDVLVLCYHAVSERWPSELAVSPELLDRQLAELEGRGYRVTTFTRAVTDPPWPKTLAVTFDDAYRSTLEQAAPVLARHNAPGTVYAPTDWVGRAEPMTWPGIEEWSGRAAPRRAALPRLGRAGRAEAPGLGGGVAHALAPAAAARSTTRRSSASCAARSS